MTASLSVCGYTLDYATPSGLFRALDGVSLSVAAGEVLGLVGESGSGKTSLAWAILRALPGNAREGGGSIHLGGDDLRAMGPAALRAVRGRRIGMVFQDPATSLNPTLTLGRQITEVLRRHRSMGAREAAEAAAELLRRVDIAHPEALLDRYPHEVSGGEKQRVVIATAFACQPELIVLDEPTTALDVITGARFLDMLRRLRAETGVAALYISHDLALVSRIADRVAVLERGRLVEEAPANRIFSAPAAPYTRALVDAVPRPGRRLVEGEPGPGLLAVDALSVRYARPRLFARPGPAQTEAISFGVREGEILGVVGESGSGKSTIARALTGLVPFEGGISLQGRRVGAAEQKGRAWRRSVQIVFQHPDSSLNPRHPVGAILARPLRLYGGSLAEIPRLLDQVRLPGSYAGRYPHQLSGGEKQRVAIARAFAARPALVICDEITASLDVSVQAAVVRLLLELRSQHGTAYLFISHDLNLVRQIAHRVAVLRRGRLVDLLDVAALESDRVQPYTRELMDACPTPVG